MSVEEELSEASPGSDTLLSIGVFDGVHSGHQRLLLYLKREAQDRCCLSGIVTFPRHPRLLLHPGNNLTYITSFSERVRLIKSLGIDMVVALPFTHELAQLTAREFVLLLKKHLRMCGLVVGPNFALGRGREGVPSTLDALGKETGFTVDVVRPVLLKDQMVSSTAIREALLAGDISLTTQLLGRPFSIIGTVVHGASRRQTPGFPTANLDLDKELALPADGVYAARAYLQGKDYEAVVNIGGCPTFTGNRPRSVEVFILDFSRDLYGSEIRLEVVERLREEKCFPSADELTYQISRDVQMARSLLKQYSPGEARQCL